MFKKICLFFLLVFPRLLHAQEIDPETGTIDPVTGCEIWKTMAGPHRVSNNKPDTYEKYLEKIAPNIVNGREVYNKARHEILRSKGYDPKVVYDRAKNHIGLQLVWYSVKDVGDPNVRRPPTYSWSTFSYDQQTPRVSSHCVIPAWDGIHAAWSQTFPDKSPLDTYLDCDNTSGSANITAEGLDLTVEKLCQAIGLSDLANLTRASPEGLVRCRIRLFSPTKAEQVQHNLIVRDQMDRRLIFRPGSLTVDGSTRNPEDEDAFFRDGINIGDLGADATREIFMEARVVTASAFTGGSSLASYVLQNTAFARTDEVTEKNDEALLVIEILPVPQPPPVTQIIREPCPTCPPPPPPLPPRLLQCPANIAVSATASGFSRSPLGMFQDTNPIEAGASVGGGMIGGYVLSDDAGAKHAMWRSGLVSGLLWMVVNLFDPDKDGIRISIAGQPVSEKPFGIGQNSTWNATPTFPAGRVEWQGRTARFFVSVDNVDMNCSGLAMPRNINLTPVIIPQKVRVNSVTVPGPSQCFVMQPGQSAVKPCGFAPARP